MMNDKPLAITLTEEQRNKIVELAVLVCTLTLWTSPLPDNTGSYGFAQRYMREAVELARDVADFCSWMDDDVDENAGGSEDE